MRIKYITNVRMPTPRAQGYAIMKMCSEFAKAGASVELFVPERGSSSFKQDPFRFYKIEKNFSINKIPSFDFLGKTMKLGRLFYWVDVLSFFIVSRFVVDIKEGEVLYTRDFMAALFFPVQKSMILELHDIPSSIFLSKFLFKRAIKRFRLFFVLNDNLKKDLIDLGVAENKIHISPSAVELKDFDIGISKEEAREKVGLPQEREIVMYTGHLYKWKGVDTLAEAGKSMGEVLFVFIGGVEPELTKFIAKYKESPNIMVLPFVERHVIPLYLKSADVLALPNSKEEKISSRYTSPLKLFEYMASKRPIVASDLPSLRETLNESNCIFALPDSVGSIMVAIKDCIDHKEKASALAEKAFLDVQQFTWVRRAENILKIIKNE